MLLYKVRIFWAFVAVILAATTSCHQVNDVELLQHKLPRRGLCAHRGAADTHPENTLAAFREAVRLGAHMIEFDVRLTRDKKLVIMHDPTVDRTTDGKGEVSALTLKQIKKLDAGTWKSSRFRRERVPTLKEALQIMPRNVWINIHLRGGKEIGEQAARIIVEENRLHQAFLACGKEAALSARAIKPAILICNMDRSKGLTKYVDETIAMKANFIQLRGLITPNYPEHTNRLKENGIRVNYCCTDSPQDLLKLFESGVDFVLVNDIGSSMKVAKQLNIKPNI